MRYDHLLITGATGGVGAELLLRVLDGLPPTTVSVLMRGTTDEEVRARFRSFVRTLGSRRPGLDPTSLSAVRGDLTRPDLGLDPAIRNALRASVDAIVHGAADTRLDQPRERAQKTNRRGTTEMLRFASGCRRLQRFVHLSTAYVSGTRVGKIEESELDCGQSFLNPYERSKFDAELEVRSRMADLPLTIVRPSIVVGDSEDGHSFRTSGIFPVLRHVASGRMRDFPGLGSTRLDLVPVDHVADALRYLLFAPGALGGTFHVIAGEKRCMTARRLFELTIREVGGHPERRLRFSGRPTLADAPAGRRLLESPSCYLDYLLYDKAFDDSGFRDLVGLEVPLCPDAETYLPVVLRAAFRSSRGRRESASAPARATTESAISGSP